MKKPFILAVLCTTLLSLCAKAQYNTAGSYPFKAETVTFSYLSGGTDVSTTLAVDEAIVSVPIGFTFNFSGTSYTSVAASSNGWMSFINPSNPGSHWYFDNTDINNHLDKITPVLMPFWDDLNGRSPATASYLTSGTAPNRVFTFEWKNWGYYEGTVSSSISFQVLLRENGGNNTIEYRYKRETNSAPGSGATLGATIGIAKSISDYQTLSIASSSPSSSNSVYTTNITTQPATDQSYYWGCPVNISTHPVNKLVCASDDFNFTVSSSNATAYQWQVNTGSGFTDLANNTTYNGVTTNTLEVNDVTGTMDGYKYRCMVGTSTCSIASNEATLSVSSTATSITAQPPTTKSVCKSSNTTIGITAVGGGVTYQWQVDIGSGYNDLSNSTLYSDVTTNLLKINSAPSSINGYRYRCVVKGVCAPVILNSAPCELTVNAIPTVAGQPVNRVICASENTSFSLTSSDASGYQWQVDDGSGFTAISNNTVYGGATTNTLAITAAGTSMNGYKYRCILNNTNCDAPSNEVTLTVHNTATAITSDPPTTSPVCENANKTIGITAVGGNLTYQWQVNTGSGYANITNTAPYSNVTTATLTITNAQLGLNGYKYRCVVSGTCTPASVTSAESELIVNALPVNADAPTNSTICAGANTTFSATATGAATYKWQINTGSGFNDLAADAIHSNVTTTTVDITAGTAGMNGNRYRMVAISTAGCSVNGSSATLTVNTSPAITTQPINKAGCDGGPISFSTVATGTALTYQWQEDAGSGFVDVVNGGIYSNATTSTLNLSAVTGAMTGYTYRCKIGGTCTPEVITDVVTLTVNSLPTITTNPLDATICAGSNTTFSGAATGASTYKWQVNAGSGFTDLANTAPYSNVTTTTLDVTAATASMNNYKYRIIVTTAANCSATSTAANLTMNTAPVITKQPTNQTVCDGTAASFTLLATGTALTYQWQEDAGSGFVNVGNTGIYSGATTNTLSMTAVPTAMNGYAYRCLISGTCSPNANSDVVYLTVNPLPVVTTQPLNSTVCVGNNTSFTANATGAATYKWQLNTGSGFSNLTDNATYSNVATNSLTVTNVTAAMTGYIYRVVVSSNAGCTANNSNSATLTVNIAPNITANPVNSTICENGSTSFSVTATGTAPVYQWQVDNGSGFVNLSNGGVYSNTTTNTLNISGAPASMNSYEYRCLVGGACPPVKQSTNARLTINTSPVITLNPKDSTICAGIPATFTIAATGSGLTYQWQERSGSLFIDLNNNGNYTGVNTNVLRLSNTTPQQNGYQYRCLVTGTCAPDAMSGVANLTVHAYTAITQDPPASAVTCELTDLQLPVVSNGSNLTYQWQVNTGTSYIDVANGPLYNGATSSVLTIIAPPAFTSGYQFICKVNGVCGSQDVTTISKIIVNQVPKVSVHPSDVTVEEFKPAVFQVSATGTSISYQWQVNDGVAGWTDLFDNFAHKGTKTTKLEVLGAYYSKDGYQYRCVVSGVCPADTTTPAILTVTQIPNSIGSTKFENTGITVYPNPVTGSEMILKLDNPTAKELKVSISDQLGRKVFEGMATLSTQNTTTIDVSGLVPGMYNLQVIGKEETQVHVLRFVKY